MRLFETHSFRFAQLRSWLEEKRKTYRRILMFFNHQGGIARAYTVSDARR